MSAAPQINPPKMVLLEVTGGPHAGAVIQIANFPYKIGRNPDNDLALVKDGKVSRAQAEFQIRDGKVIIQNLSQKAPLIVNGQKMSGAIINSDCEIAFGDTLIRVKVSEVGSMPALNPPPPQVAGNTLAHMQVLQQQATTIISPATNASANAPEVPANSGLIRLATSVPLSPGSTHQGPDPFSPAPAQFPVAQPYVGGVPTAPPPGVPPMGGGYGGQVQHPHSFFGGAAAPGFPTAPPLKKSSSNMFYILIIVIGVLGYWLMGSPGKKQNIAETNPLVESERVLLNSEENIKNLKQIKKDLGQESMQYNLAQSHYIKGFRDFRNGQYSRAIPSFEAALAFYPKHELARKYLNQSKVKLDQVIASLMNQGRQYKSKNNYRLCSSTFTSAMNMISDIKDNRYREAKQLLEECDFLLEGKF